MKVFISYATAEDQVHALRLQTLGAVYGITSYVPSAVSRKLLMFPVEIETKLKETDLVLSLCTDPTAESAPIYARELEAANRNNKPTVTLENCPVCHSVHVERYRFCGSTHHQADEINAMVTLATGLLLLEATSKRKGHEEVEQGDSRYWPTPENRIQTSKPRRGAA